MVMEENLWKNFISELDIELSEKGLEAPELESIIDDTQDIRGMLIKISFDSIMFMNHSQTKYYMLQSNQRLTQMGETTLKEVLVKYNKKQNKK